MLRLLGKVPPAGGDDPEPAAGAAVGAIATVTTNVDKAVLPDGSVAVHVTVVAPSWKTDPDAGMHATLEEPELSVAFGGANVTVAPVPEVIVTVMSAGSPIEGFSLSLTTRLNDALAVFPARSVAVQPTVVVPIGKNEPDAGVQTMFPAGSATASSVSTCARGGSASDARDRERHGCPVQPRIVVDDQRGQRNRDRWRDGVVGDGVVCGRRCHGSVANGVGGDAGRDGGDDRPVTGHARDGDRVGSRTTGDHSARRPGSAAERHVTRR